MGIQETYKDIEINERNFRLKKIEARTGSFLLFKLVKILAPVFQGLDLDNLDKVDLNDINLTDALGSIFDLPEDEFRYIQDNCLRVIQEDLSGDFVNILDKDGNFAVADLEYDTGLLMNLTIQSLVFIVKGFFTENLLGSMLEGLNLSQPTS